MISQGLLLLCIVACVYGYGKPYPMKHKPIVHKKFIPIVKRIKVPVYIQREIRVPVYIDREVPVPYPVGGGIRGGAVGGGSGAIAGAGSGGIDFGLKAQIEDADTVNIHAGVGGGFVDNNNFNNDFNGGDFNNFNGEFNDFNNNDNGGVIGGIAGAGQGIQGLVGFDQSAPASIDVSQTQISQPSIDVSQPQIGGGHGHGPQVHKAKPHF